MPAEEPRGRLGGDSVDAELRSYLEAMEQRITRKVDAVDAKVAAVDAKADSARAAAESARSDAHILHEATMKAIGTVIDGLNMLRTAVEGRADDRERTLMNRHIGPLEASAANHERRITALEKGSRG
jgi:hypothetical protein